MNNGSKTLILFGVWIWALGYYSEVWNVYMRVLLGYRIVTACIISVIESDDGNRTIFDKIVLLTQYHKIHYRKFIALVIGFPGMFNLNFNITSLGSLMLILGSIIRLASKDRINDNSGYDTFYTMV